MKRLKWFQNEDGFPVSRVDSIKWIHGRYRLTRKSDRARSRPPPSQTALLPFYSFQTHYTAFHNSRRSDHPTWPTPISSRVFLTSVGSSGWTACSRSCRSLSITHRALPNGWQSSIRAWRRRFIPSASISADEMQNCQWKIPSFSALTSAPIQRHVTNNLAMAWSSLCDNFDLRRDQELRQLSSNLHEFEEDDGNAQWWSSALSFPSSTSADLTWAITSVIWFVSWFEMPESELSMFLKWEDRQSYLLPFSTSRTTFGASIPIVWWRKCSDMR